jgi:hypothetical protein
MDESGGLSGLPSDWLATDPNGHVPQLGPKQIMMILVNVDYVTLSQLLSYR